MKGWILLDDFVGEPGSRPWLWWWSRETGLDCAPAMLDERGGILDKLSNGSPYFSHVRIVPADQVPGVPGT